MGKIIVNGTAIWPMGALIQEEQSAQKALEAASDGEAAKE